MAEKEVFSRDVSDLGMRYLEGPEMERGTPLAVGCTVEVATGLASGKSVHLGLLGSAVPPHCRMCPPPPLPAPPLPAPQGVRSMRVPSASVQK